MIKDGVAKKLKREREKEKVENKGNSSNNRKTSPVDSSKSITMFSDYGYIQVPKEEIESKDLNLVNISNKRNTLHGRIQKANLKEEIKINLKTLYGERKLYSYCVRIDDKISTLVKRLAEDEEIVGVCNKPNSKEASDVQENKSNNVEKWNRNYQYRLVSTVGEIKELTPTNTFTQEKIKNGQTLILASPLKLEFSSVMHGPGILIQNNNSTAYKQTSEEHQYAFASRGYSSGINYCEFTLETEPDEKNIIIGVSLSRQGNDYYYSSDSKTFWGYTPSDCKKVSSSGNVDYGDICKMGDKIGILMEFSDKGLDVSFFINKLDLGVAFKNLPHNTYYPCALLLYEGAKVKLTNRIPLPDNIKD